ncbi:MmgE/PrpD family protein [Pseudomonas sp. NPDC087346]|uniref:MmgE/PrpD family protein n=1 Tax=Pseudomonas sp. NPDC087346 TaxID=3364438 RepID=UPI0037F65534
MEENINKSLIVSMAEWITQRGSTWPPKVVQRVEHALGDTIACMIAGSVDAVAIKARTAAEAWGVGDAKVVGSSIYLSAPGAALVNGTAAHVLEIDDNYYPALTHASAVIVPALLALADEIEASGEKIIDAYIVGLELHALLGRGVNRSHYFTGWHPTATIGCIGTAGACARLLGLNLSQTIAAMSIATSMAAGNKAQFGTEVKSLQCGFGASNAVKAARLAEAGIEGNPNVLEDPQGFLHLYGGPDPRGWSEPLKKLDNPLAMQEFGLAPKRHACCGSAHNTLDSILEIKSQHEFDSEDIQSIDILVGASNKKNLRYDDPKDEFKARFSMNYNVALILLQGKVCLADFTSEAITRPKVKELMKLVHMESRSFQDEPNDPDERPPHLVKITLKNGVIYERSRVYAKGLIQEPFNDVERRQKIEGCCQGIMSEADISSLIELLRGVSWIGNIRTLTDMLSFGSK